MSDNRKPNPDEVICPNCTHQFRAIPVNVQRELSAAREVSAAIDREKQAAIERLSTLPPTHVVVPVEPTDEQEAAGGVVLWEKQFEGTPWKNKVKLIDPASMGEYNEVARHVYEAMLAARKP